MVIGEGTPAPPYSIIDEDDAIRFLVEYNGDAEVMTAELVSKEWDYNTNLTDHNQELMVRPAAFNILYLYL